MFSFKVLMTDRLSFRDAMSCPPSVLRRSASNGDQAKEQTGVSDAEDRPWGDRAAVVTDPDGYKWVLATFKKLAPFS